MEKLNKSNLLTVSKAYTHGGVFHADDVFSSALLELMNPSIEIARIFSVPEDAELVFDIGGGLYDHHQEDSAVRENGIPYAAFGLLWRDLGAEFLGSKEEADLFDQNFVQPIDLTDNTGEPNTLSSAIGSFNPTWDDNAEKADERFRDAVEFAVQILLNYKKRAEGKLKAHTLVEEALNSSKDGIVVLPRFAPWQEVLIPEEKARLVIYPSQRGGYNLQVVPKEYGTQEPKVPIPKKWLLETAPKGCTFVHKGLFLAAFTTKDDAVDAASTMVQQYKVPIWEQYEFDNAQMAYIRHGLKEGLDVSVYARPEFSGEQMEQICLGLEQGLDVSVYARPEFHWCQMEEILLGLEQGLDVSIYARPEFQFRQMREIRSGLEEHLDVSVYARPDLSCVEMQGIRSLLNKGYRIIE